MKIASYNMAQYTMSKYQNYHKRSIKTDVIQRKQIPVYKVEFKDYLQPIEDDDAVSEAELKANIDLIESLIAYLTHREFKFQEVPRIQTDKTRNYVLRVSMENETYESEEMAFSSTGKITTDDGNTIDFSYDLKMSREFYERNQTTIQTGNRMLDPLILNLDNKGANFGDQKIHIDLDLDGQIDTFNMLTSGSGFLVLDKNNNGTVDDGSELFGPKTDSGFGELSDYDKDGNHWIDENDDIFNSLKIWTIDDDGQETLIGFKEAGIGAIYLGGIEGNFDYKNGHDVIARITGSSIYLREDGRPGAIHEVKV